MSGTQKTSLTLFLSYLPWLLNLLTVITSLPVEIFLVIINRGA